MGKRGTTSGLSSSGTSASQSALNAAQQAAPAPAPAPAAQQPAPAPQQRTSGLVSDTGVQDMDDATLTQLIQRAKAAPGPTDGRDNTILQRIADALGISSAVPESVPQEALAQFRSQRGENGLMYRTVRAAGGKTARQIAHELTDHTGNFGYNYGGGRAYGSGIYFAAQGSGNSPGGAARHSAGYGRSDPNAYTIEAMYKPGARVATNATLRSAAAKRWALAHQGALRAAGIHVDSTGAVNHRLTRMDSDDVRTTMAMLMGYDAYRESASSDVYHTVFNLGALRVARGNKYSRACAGTLT